MPKLVEQLVLPPGPLQLVIPKLVEQLVLPPGPLQLVIPKLVEQLTLSARASCIDTKEVATTIVETAPKPPHAKIQALTIPRTRFFIS
jgi:hypothetical protein